MTYNAGHKCPNIGKIILTQTLTPILHMRSLHVDLMGHFVSLREHLIRETAYLFRQDWRAKQKMIQHEQRPCA